MFPHSSNAPTSRLRLTIEFVYKAIDVIGLRRFPHSVGPDAGFTHQVTKATMPRLGDRVPERKEQGRPASGWTMSTSCLSTTALSARRAYQATSSTAGRGVAV